ncbi:MAG: hypothetical protein VKJ06_06460 [Vampirovibrionales bacterium]|nr:hypothetical protein [Vampirovibrionales bacterium]
MSKTDFNPVFWPCKPWLKTQTLAFVLSVSVLALQPLSASALWGFGKAKSAPEDKYEHSTPLTRPCKAKPQQSLQFLPPSANPEDKLPVTASASPKASPLGAEGPAETPEDLLAPVALTAVEAAPSLEQIATQKRQREQLLNAAVSVVKPQEPSQAEALLAKAEALDKKNLESLWTASVELNPMIRFSLEKLALPVDLHEKHSSQFASKTLGALITGAALGASMFAGAGAGSYQNMGLMAGSDIARNLVTGRNKAVEQVLSPSELVQLAGLVDDLKVSLINAYYDYKNTLAALGPISDETTRQHDVYELSTLQTTNPSAALASSAAYYQSLQQETLARQKAQRYRMRLERLAGVEAVGQIQWLDTALALAELQKTDAAKKAQEAQEANTAKTALESAPKQPTKRL